MPRTYRMATCCPDKRHYGKGMCKACYRKHVKPIRQWKAPESYFTNLARAKVERAKATGIPICRHKDRPIHKATVCQECYEAKQEEKRGKYNSEEGLRHYLKKTYGITVEDLERMYFEQGGQCAICGVEGSIATGAGQNERLHVDHDHDTHEVRGLLCHRCNRGLGCFLESPDTMTSAAEYIRRHKSASQGKEETGD